MYYVQKNNLFLAQLPEISANWNENYMEQLLMTLQLPGLCISKYYLLTKP